MSVVEGRRPIGVRGDRRVMRWEASVPKIVADIVDAYVIRKVNARIQFLLLLRRPDVALGNTWQSIHEQIEPGETALEAAERAILASTGLSVIDVYSADYVNQM